MRAKVMEISLRVAKEFGHWSIIQEERYNTGHYTHKVLSKHSTREMALATYKGMFGLKRARAKNKAKK